MWCGAGEEPGGNPAELETAGILRQEVRGYLERFAAETDSQIVRLKARYQKAGEFSLRLFLCVRDYTEQKKLAFEIMLL